MMWPFPYRILIQDKIDFLRDDWEFMSRQAWRFYDSGQHNWRSGENFSKEAHGSCKLWLQLKANKLEQERM